jgi:hypothetical protein
MASLRLRAEAFLASTMVQSSLKSAQQLYDMCLLLVAQYVTKYGASAGLKRYGEWVQHIYKRWRNTFHYEQLVERIAQALGSTASPGDPILPPPLAATTQLIIETPPTSVTFIPHEEIATVAAELDPALFQAHLEVVLQDGTIQPRLTVSPAKKTKSPQV